jgi:hypothetical protein
MLRPSLFALGLCTCLLALGCTHHCCNQRPQTVATAPVVPAPTPCGPGCPAGVPPAGVGPGGQVFAPPGGVIVPRQP